MCVQESPLQIQGPFRSSKPIVLASASPRRQALLTGLGLHFRLQPSNVPEPRPKPEESARDYVQRMAQFKARTGSKEKTPGVILAADTVVVDGQHILGKPESFSEALEMLTRLNATTHTVLTGCCLLDRTEPDLGQVFSVATQVTFSQHPPDMLSAYVRTGEPMGKAGGYAIQGVGAFLVSQLHGSYSNVVGLPLSETVSALLDIQAINVAIS